ncbi:MAG: GMP/IMP nucleotidase [bacterium]
MSAQTQEKSPIRDWSDIDTVLLDMDGTLLDLHFDNYFWREFVPLRYAQHHGLEPEQARDELMKRYAAIEGRLQWYCVDHWSKELDLDIVLLKREVRHLIQVHPHVLDFLSALEQAGKKRVLVTNAHQQAMGLKLEKTRLHGHLDEVISAHELGLPKEDHDFWEKLQTRHAFDPERTLFIDDSLPMLVSARAYGIRHLLHVLHPDSRQPPQQPDEFPAVHNFSTLLPALSG